MKQCKILFRFLRLEYLFDDLDLQEFPLIGSVSRLAREKQALLMFVCFMFSLTATSRDDRFWRSPKEMHRRAEMLCRVLVTVNDHATVSLYIHRAARHISTEMETLASFSSVAVHDHAQTSSHELGGRESNRRLSKNGSRDGGEYVHNLQVAQGMALANAGRLIAIAAADGELPESTKQKNPRKRKSMTDAEELPPQEIDIDTCFLETNAALYFNLDDTVIAENPPVKVEPALHLKTKPKKSAKPTSATAATSAVPAPLDFSAAPVPSAADVQAILRAMEQCDTGDFDLNLDVSSIDTDEEARSKSAKRRNNEGRSKKTGTAATPVVAAEAVAPEPTNSSSLDDGYSTLPGFILRSDFQFQDRQPGTVMHFRPVVKGEKKTSQQAIVCAVSSLFDGKLEEQRPVRLSSYSEPEYRGGRGSTKSRTEGAVQEG